jgi:hypothetical protein
MSADRDTARIVQSWLRADDKASASGILESVLAGLDDAPQRHRLRSARRIVRPNAYARLAAPAAAAVAIAIVGLFLLRGGTGPGGPAESPSHSAGPTPTPTPTPTPARMRPSEIDVGFIGLPPEGAAPSKPETGILVDTYEVNGVGMPFDGLAWLYADGRLIWYRFFDGPAGRNGHSTGYLEQRLTAEGVELVRNRGTYYDKDPLWLPGWLPQSAWQDQRIRAYVPSRFAVCLANFDPYAPIEDRIYPGVGAPMDRTEMLALFPPPAADLLRDRQALPPFNDPHDCLALTTEEARLLDAALRDGGLEQDAQQNRYVLQYQRDAPGPGSSIIVISFEPRFPDGTYGCSSCG